MAPMLTSECAMNSLRRLVPWLPTPIIPITTWSLGFLAANAGRFSAASAAPAPRVSTNLLRDTSDEFMSPIVILHFSSDVEYPGSRCLDVFGIYWQFVECIERGRLQPAAALEPACR